MKHSFKNKNLIDVYKDYSLVLSDTYVDSGETFYEYSILSPAGKSIDMVLSTTDWRDVPDQKYFSSNIARQFEKSVDVELEKKKSAQFARAKKACEKSANAFYAKFPNISASPSYSAGSYSNSYSNYYSKKTGYVDKLNKSDTLVIHKTDPTTTMLNQIYEGKGWDVLNDTYVDTNEIHQLLESHSRIIMLGHGTTHGLIGGNIGPEEAPYLADKNLFVIWCNADAFFNHYLPNKHGFYCTGNMPSDADEASWVGFHVSRQYMDENITYWCKLCADVTEQALSGDAEGATKYIRDKYWEKYGQGYNVDEVSDDSHVKQDIPDEVRITKYNYNRTKVQ